MAGMTGHPANGAGARFIWPAPISPPISSPTNPWRKATPLPWRNHDISAVTLNGRIHVAGGLARLGAEPHPGTAFATLLGRAPDTGRWACYASLRAPRIYAATTAFSGEVWVLGGDEVTPGLGRQPVVAVESFGPDRWAAQVRPPLPLALPVPVAAAVGETLCAVGRPPGSDRLAAFALYEPVGSWRELAAGPRTTCAIAGCGAEDCLYVAIPGESLWSFTPSCGGRWRSVGGPAMPRSPQMAVSRGAIWILGGREAGAGTEVLIYEPAAARWGCGPVLPEPLAWGAATVCQDELFVIGGAWDDPTQPGGWSYSDRTWVLAEPRVG